MFYVSVWSTLTLFKIFSLLSSRQVFFHSDPCWMTEAKNKTVKKTKITAKIPAAPEHFVSPTSVLTALFINNWTLLPLALCSVYLAISCWLSFLLTGLSCCSQMFVSLHFASMMMMMILSISRYNDGCYYLHASSLNVADNTRWRGLPLSSR